MENTNSVVQAMFEYSYLVERRLWLLIFSSVSKKCLARDYNFQNVNTLKMSAKILGFVTNTVGFPCHGDIVKRPWMIGYELFYRTQF